MNEQKNKMTCCVSSEPMGRHGNNKIPLFLRGCGSLVVLFFFDEQFLFFRCCLLGVLLTVFLLALCMGWKDGWMRARKRVQ
ncbi:hypothetical protein BKA57DRAFT_821 [Linnemannia elongata]|nr:hypothetical protein BKA57DRAFT_821 [Linnemannia elongata]